MKLVAWLFASSTYSSNLAALFFFTWFSHPLPKHGKEQLQQGIWERLMTCVHCNNNRVKFNTIMAHELPKSMQNKEMRTKQHLYGTCQKKIDWPNVWLKTFYNTERLLWEDVLKTTKYNYIAQCQTMSPTSDTRNSLVKVQLSNKAQTHTYSKQTPSLVYKVLKPKPSCSLVVGTVSSVCLFPNKIIL